MAMIVFGTQLIAGGFWTAVVIRNILRNRGGTYYLGLHGWGIPVMVVAILFVAGGVRLAMSGVRLGASPQVCTCGRPLSPGTQFCAGCGRKTGPAVQS
jgi:hypothetical protein